RELMETPVSLEVSLLDEILGILRVPREAIGGVVERIQERQGLTLELPAVDRCPSLLRHVAGLPPRAILRRFGRRVRRDLVGERTASDRERTQLRCQPERRRTRALVAEWQP